MKALWTLGTAALGLISGFVPFWLLGYCGILPMGALTLGMGFVIGSVVALSWGGTTYLNMAPHGNWIRKALLAFLKATGAFLIALPAIFCLYSLAATSSWMVPFCQYGALLTAAFLAYGVWRWSIRTNVSAKEVRAEGLFYTWLRAPHAPHKADTENVAHPRDAAYVLIRCFETELLKNTAHRFRPHPVLYLDGCLAVPLRPVDALGACPIGRVGMRSHAFKIQEGLGDEYWFVLHTKVEADEVFWQLDATSRSRNYLEATLLIGTLLITLGAWLLRSNLVFIAISALGVMGMMHHVGLWKLFFDSERGDKRRAARLEEHVVLAENAVFQALNQLPCIPPIPPKVPVTPAHPGTPPQRPAASPVKRRKVRN